MHCPECSSGLLRHVYADVSIHACEACGGEFIGGSLADVIRSRPPRSPELSALLAEDRPAFGGRPMPDAPSLMCPACGERMTLAEYGDKSGVFVFRCESCDGLWLRQSDLERIQGAVESWAEGALERLEALAAEVQSTRRPAPDAGAPRYAFVNALLNRILDAA